MPQLQLGLEQVLAKLNKEKKEGEAKLKKQLEAEKKKLEILERHFAFGEIDSEIYQKFGKEVRARTLVPMCSNFL